MGDHIRAEGWNNWRNPENEKTARYVEFGSQTLDGKPRDLSGARGVGQNSDARRSRAIYGSHYLGRNGQTKSVR